MGNCLFNDKVKHVNTPTYYATDIHHQRLSQHLNPDPKYNKTTYIPTPKVHRYPDYNRYTIPSYPSQSYPVYQQPPIPQYVIPQRPPPYNPEYSN